MTRLKTQDLLEKARPNLRGKLEGKLEIVDDVVRSLNTARKEILFANDLFQIPPAETIARYAMIRIEEKTDVQVLGYAVSLAMEMLGYQKAGRNYRTKGFVSSAYFYENVEHQSQE